MQQETVKRKRGRPAAFDADTALESAMRTFWKHGFEGTSMSTLTEALGMNKASIYAAFGSKEDLFDKVIDRYLKGPSSFVIESLNKPTAIEVVESLLKTAAHFFTNEAHPNGCMITQSALSCSAEAKHIHDKLARLRAGYEEALAYRFEQAISDSDLPKEVDSWALAKMVTTVHQGMSVQASSGASEEELLQVVDLILKQFTRGT